MFVITKVTIEVFSMLEKTVCELFAGVGGFRVGLQRSSEEWNTVWANQWEPNKKLQHAFKCYCSHFKYLDTHVNKDIADVVKSDIPNHNFLVGGFPCQDYSVARTGAMGINGVKGVLWWQINDILIAKTPRFVLLENVDRLLKSPTNQRGRDFGIILACFNNAGYNVEWRVINAAEYGLAQRRRRVFIFAYKTDANHYNSMNNFNDIEVINEKGFFATTFPIEHINQINTIEFNYSDLVEVSDGFNFAFNNSGIMRNGTISTVKTSPKYQGAFIKLGDTLEDNVDEKYYLKDNIDKWVYLKGSKKIDRVSKTGHEYTFSEGPVAFPDSLDKPARTMLTSESSINRSTHVVRDPQTKRLRLLTPIETERIQGFDENWTNTDMPEKFRYFCMGNALVTGLIERMGFTLNYIFDQE